MSVERGISPSSYWRSTKARLGYGTGELLGEICPECGKLIIPSRDSCPTCRHNFGPPPLPGEEIIFEEKP